MKNCASDCWTILPATVAHHFERLDNRASDYWRILPAIDEALCQHCWRIMSVTVDESFQRYWTACELFFSLFLTYFGKTLPSFSCKYFNYYWLFQSMITTEKASRLLIKNYLHILIIHVLPTFVTFQNRTYNTVCS